MAPDELARRFTHQPPTGDQPDRYVRIRGEALALAITIAETTPEGREQSLAITALEEAVFWANAAIARREASRPNERFSTEHGWPAGTEEQQDRAIARREA